MDEITSDLNSVFNKVGYIILSVDSKDSSARDWAVWSKAKVFR